MNASIRLAARPWFCLVLLAAMGLFLSPAVIGQEPAPSVSFTAEDRLIDQSALLPLNEWVPLFSFSMTFAEDMPATRTLPVLAFQLKDDPVAGDRPYEVRTALRSTDLFQLGIFRDQSPPPAGDGILNAGDTIVMGRGPNAGRQLRFNLAGQLVDTFNNPVGGTVQDSDPSALGFAINLTNFEINTSPDTEDGIVRYIVAIRTSARWRNGVSLAYQLNFALMSPIVPEDTYSPDFFMGEILDPQTAYCSSFAAWDITGGQFTNLADPRYANAWAHPMFIYTPLGEQVRLRLDAPLPLQPVFDFVTGEVLHLRRILSLDNWAALIGINLHGTPGPRESSINSAVLIDGPHAPPDFPGPFVGEVNLIFTDIGADPLGQPGNGGFNPRSGLETITNIIDDLDNPDVARRRDFSFNGAWVFHDTNGNGVFDPPVPLGGAQGVSFAGGDYPMFPEFGSAEAQWEYVPMPPTGGDPWWKLRIQLDNFGRRRSVGEVQQPSGYLDPTPDGPAFGTFPQSFFNDYFVVVRPDSGYQDVQGLPGDGTGLTYGADFRAFIEPRMGRFDGGIYVSTMIPAPTAWQADGRWGVNEPWWPERTLNETNAKPVRSNIDVHDLVLNYDSSNLFGRLADNNYGTGPVGLGTGAFSPAFVPEFSNWLDPFGTRSTMFADVHGVGVVGWVRTDAGLDDHLFRSFQSPYETVPFRAPGTTDTRSQYLPSPPIQPTLPGFSTWPAILAPGEYPRESQWSLANRRARYLKQHIDPESGLTAMLGINLAGANDPIVNQFTQVRLEQFFVAFWGPSFHPSDLLPLGLGGVQLWEEGTPDPDATPRIPPVYVNQNGVFGAQGPHVTPIGLDTPVPLSNLRWPAQPEFIDVLGDGSPDDMNGDGVINDLDKAWVLTLRPAEPWPLPVVDDVGGFFPIVDPIITANASFDAGSELAAANAIEDTSEEPKAPAEVRPEGKSYWAKAPQTVTAGETAQAVYERANSEKQFGPAGNPGDDLYVVVQTSETLTRFEQFRCVIPSTLPERQGNQRIAGFHLSPQQPISLDVYEKSHPEEGPVTPYYGPAPFGYDMIEANVAAKIVPMPGATQRIYPNSGDVAVLGINLSTNRGKAIGTVARGVGATLEGTGGPGTFTVSAANWTPDQFVDDFLVDRRYKAFRIRSNTRTRLDLEATPDANGTPASGRWMIVRDPSFLEQLMVEFFDPGRVIETDEGDRWLPSTGFNIHEDLLPLDPNPNRSGVKLYRDNDFNPGNVNGDFDEGDIPVELDYPPFFTGQGGEPNIQVMFVFSSPGTDNLGLRGVSQSLESQPRRRHWIPDTFGADPSDPDWGPDFFVVIETSEDIDPGNRFVVQVVSWGPNTPTEPDPDTFPPPSAQDPTARIGEFDLFSEFPWGARAIGLVSLFKAATYYKQFPEVDNVNITAGGMHFVRSAVNKSGFIELEARSAPAQLRIDSVSPTRLPKVVGAQGIELIIDGQNFGPAPNARLDGLNLQILGFSNTRIRARIPAGTVLDEDNDGRITLRVTDTTTGQFDTFRRFQIVQGGGLAPDVTSVDPNQGTSAVFPVTVRGTNFEEPEVFFEGTRMPIQGTPTSTAIIVGFPIGGLPQTGPLDVTVRNQLSGLSDTLPDGFTYVNTPGGGGGGPGSGFGPGGGLPGCFIATAAFGTPFEKELGTLRGFRDDVLLKSALGVAAVDLYYSVSPYLADDVARSPVLAQLVRAALSPLVWLIEMPWLALIAPAAFSAYWLTRRRARLYRVRLRGKEREC